MYDVVLISPHYNYDPHGRPNPDIGAAEFQNLSMIVPLGIVHVAQYLYNCGFQVKVVHLPHEFRALQALGLDLERLESPLEAILQHYPARVCGLQAHFYLYAGGAVRIAAVYRKLFPQSTILVGGYMATACWKQIMQTAPDIDGVILGEGETTVRRVAETLRSPHGNGLKAIDGLAIRGPNDTYVHNPARADTLLDLAQMPTIDPKAPPFDRIMWPERGFMNISRGRCPDDCAYCVANNRRINPRRFRTMTVDRILTQLAIYQENGMHSIFLGENHFLNMDFMQTLIEEIIRADFDLYFELETHPLVFADRRLLDRMVAAGFLRFTLGGESGSDRLLRRMGRRSNTRQIMHSVRQIAAAGGLAVTSWICNLPGETAADFKATQDLIADVAAAGGFVYWIENLHVLPGSPLHRSPEKWDMELLLKDLSEWFRWSLYSKSYVNFDDALKTPRKYLTHLNRNSTPEAMITRFYTLRRQARMLVPHMKRNLKAQAPHLPPALTRTERRNLDWYAERGWKLWLF